jgi:hypothetical protein
MSDKKSIWYKMGNIDYRWLYALSIIFTLFPVLYPLGLPVTVSAGTVGYFEAIDKLPPGSVVAVSFGASAQLLDEQDAQFIATWKLLFQRDLKVLVYSSLQDGPILMQNYFGKRVIPESYGKVYGKDYVVLGYALLGEAGEASMAISIRGVYSTDQAGTPLDSLPMMANINSAKDIDLLIFVYTSCTDVEWPVRQWVTPYGTKCIIATLGCCGPMAVPYYPAQVQGFLSGSGMGTELEVLGRVPGPGAAMSDAKNIGILPFLVFFVLGNLSYLGKRFKWGEKK